MKQKFYKIFRKSIAARLLLLFSLLIGGGNSVWAQKSLPYSYGFENNNLASEGWTIVDGCTRSSYETKIYNSQLISFNSNYFFRFHAAELAPQYLISPELESSLKGIDVSFYYRGYGNSSSASVAFQVGYSFTNAEVSSFTWEEEVSFYSATYSQYKTSFPVGTKYIAIKYNTSDNNNNYRWLGIDDINVEQSNPFKIPTAFSLNSYSSNSATFSWTAGNSETAWQFDYSTDPDFSPGSGINGTNGDITTGDLVDGKYTLSGLTTNTTYYASIRANYGGGNYSEWSEKISFVPRNETEFTINAGSTTTNYAPIYGGNASYIACSQVVISGSMLTEIQNRQITKLTFYASQTSVNWGEATYEVYLKLTDTSSYSAWTGSFESWGTNVFNEGTLSVSDNKMVVKLNTPFNYTSGNLLIGIKQISKGKSSTVSWDGVSTSGYTVCYSSNSATNYSNKSATAPKITFTTTGIESAPVKIGATGFTTFSSAWPLDLSSLPNGLTAYYASSQNGSNVTLTKATTEVSAGTGLVLKGTAGQTYAIPVAASGSNISGNLLVGVTSETAVDASASKYVLVNNGGTAEFQSLEDNGATIPAGKAYLNTAGASARLSILFDDNDNTATSIKTAKTIDKTSIIYNLMGQKVKGSKPGLYIKNGKKVVKK